MLNWRELCLAVFNPCSSDPDLCSMEGSHQDHDWRFLRDSFWGAPWSHSWRDWNEIVRLISPAVTLICHIYCCMVKLHPLLLPPFISSFCNWMHVSITDSYCPFSSDGLRETRGLGHLRAPPQWNCKWRPAASPCGGQEGPAAAWGLQDPSQDSELFQCMGVVGRAERLQGTESSREGACLGTWRDKLPFAQGALEGSICFCAWK